MHKRVVRIAVALAILGLAILLAVLMINGGNDTAEEEAESPATEITAIEVSPGRYAPQMTWVGTVMARREAELSTPIAADVLELLVGEGDSVVAGQPLIELDTRQLDWDLAQVRTEVRELELSREQMLDQQATDEAMLALERELLTQSERALARERGLRERGASTEAALDEAESRTIQARQSVRQRESALAQHPRELSRLELQRERAEIGLARLEDQASRAAMTAPFDGIVDAVNTSAGQQVGSGQVLVALHDPDSRVWRVNAPDRNAEALEARLDSAWVAQSRRAARVSEGTASRYVEFPVPAALDWAPGEMHQALVQRPHMDNVQPVPAAALYSNNRIFLVDDDDQLQSRVIAPLGATWIDGDEYWLIDAADLPADGLILASRLPNVLNGLRVEVTETRTVSSNQEQ